MTSTSLTRLPRSSKQPGGLWRRLLPLLVLGWLAASCSRDATGIGVGLPGADATTGAYLIDTLTVRSSTVLRDSVVTSNSTNLLLGRYTDPQLGTVQASSYFGVGLLSSFVPDGSLVYDSLVLTLAPSSGTTAFRYGDTLRTQQLVKVFKLGQQLPTNKPLFAAPRLTPLAGTYNAQTDLLNRNGVVRVRRASPLLGTLRMRLDDALGQQLMLAGQRGQIRTQDQMLSFLPGLAIAPDATDNAALLTFNANSDDSSLRLYYHDPATPTVPQSTGFTVSAGGPHCFQVELLNRASSVLGSNLPPQTLDAVYANRLGEQSVIMGGIGLQTRLEIPYLRDLYQLGQRLTITSAQLALTVPNTSTTTSLALAPPSALRVSTSNLNKQPVNVFTATVPYGQQTSPTTALQQGAYLLTNDIVNSYIQQVLANTIPNNGLLLSSATPELPNRVILGSTRNPQARLQLRLYVVSTN